MKAYFVEQAAYQGWACDELFKSLDTLGDEQRQAHVGLFFNNIHKTTDHILVVTRNWRARLDGAFDHIVNYDTLLYPQWAELKLALLAEFTELHIWLAQKPEPWFFSGVEYPGAGGNVRKIGVSDALTHIMTHAVHHRGQISAAATRLHAPSPEMDFVFYRWRAKPHALD